MGCASLSVEERAAVAPLDGDVPLVPKRLCAAGRVSGPRIYGPLDPTLVLKSGCPMAADLWFRRRNLFSFRTWRIGRSVGGRISSNCSANDLDGLFVHVVYFGIEAGPWCSLA